MSVLKAGIFTYTLDDETLTITESMGVKMISIYNGTAVDGTYTGDQKLGSYSSEAINVELGETATVVGLEASVIQGLTIVAPAGCVLKIIAVV